MQKKVGKYAAMPSFGLVNAKAASDAKNAFPLAIALSTVGATYNRRFISVFFWILFRKIFSPALCYIWEISKPYALDNYNT